MEIAAIVFILVMLVVAYVAFRILKKTFKMALRAIIVLIIIGVAIVGGIALWSMEVGNTSGPPAKSSSR